MHVILAAGGTGGHLFPALALGQAFESARHRVSYVGSGRPLDRHVEQLSGLTWKHIRAARLKGMGLLSKLKSLLMVPRALLQALIILIQEKPDLVLGLGGYSTGPLVLAARVVGIYTAILEQNRIPGFTNRILVWFATRVFVALPLVPGPANGGHWRLGRFRKKAIVTGNPIRQEVIQQFQQTHHEEDRFTLLVFGGSQGAHFLNEAIVQLLPQLHQRHDVLSIIHITGADDYEVIKAAYAPFPELETEIIPFSDDMGGLYKRADLVLSRSGASTVSDLTYFGRAAVLVPYPYAADLHQHANAQLLADAGAAVLIDQAQFDIEAFWQNLELWLRDRGLLQEMGARAQALAPRESAAERIISECEKLV